MAKERTIYVCSECGAETTNWAGKCPSCGAWNTLKELKLSSGKTKSRQNSTADSEIHPKKIKDLSMSKELRFSTGISELDRVLGSGAVAGSLNLIGGAPGIGKSTLLLQMCGMLAADSEVLYITGEESERQIKLRADRLRVTGDHLYVFAETDLDRIVRAIETVSPDIVIIDSIQTVSDSSIPSTPGSMTQIRECTMRIMRLTKEKGLTVFLIGHITKDGTIAGPKILEHMVDCVLYFEGEQDTSFRILRAIKNRFGSTNEIGVFEMRQMGLVEVENPSEFMLSGKPKDASGSVVTCSIEGTRPILLEIQALVCHSFFNNPRRTATGLDYNRVNLLMAVIEKRLGVRLSDCDAYVNIAGGAKLNEPGVDLGIVIAVLSSHLDIAVDDGIVCFGEVGLSGEIRSVNSVEQRINEAKKLGFKTCIVPEVSKRKLIESKDINIIGVKNLQDVLQLLSSRK